MATASLHPESVTSTPSFGSLEDAAADLDTSRVFSEAAERLLADIRGWVRLYKGPGMQTLVDHINDCETLVIEARTKAKEARGVIINYVEAEVAAHHATKGRGNP